MSRKPDITVTGKRKKNRACKTASGSSTMQNWIDSTSQINNFENYNGLMPNTNTFCPPIVQSQKLYPAISDPSVCNNSYLGMPVHCRVEPTMSLPLYSNHPSVMYQNWQNSPTSHNYTRSPTKITTSTDSVYSSSKNNSDCQQNQEFISLPVIDQLIIDDSGNKRRYSDPGLGPGLSKSGGSSDCSSIITEDPKDNKLLYYLHEQVKSLMESNRKLFKELQDTKSELSGLKQKVSNYEPGCIADIVREIREAAKVREDALITKVRHMIGQVNLEQSYSSLAFNSTREVEDLRGQLNETRSLLTKKDEEIRNLKINAARMHDDPNRTKSLDDIHLAPKPPIWGFFSNIFSKVKPQNLEWGVLVEEGNDDSIFDDKNSDTQSTALMDGQDYRASQESFVTPNNKFVNSTVVDQHDPDISSLHRDIPAAQTQVIELEQENLQIRRDLQVAVDSRKEVEAKNLSYERQFHLQQRKKSPNDTIIIKNHGTVLNSTNPFENNTFVSDERQKHENHHTGGVNPFESNTSLQVTLSGPVTDL